MGAREVALHYAMRLLPIGACSWLGVRIGPLVGPLDAKADARVRKNLALLRPQWNDAELEAGRLSNWRNVGRTMAEFSVLRRLWASDRVTLHGRENYDAAQAWKARVYVGAHLGNWELLGPKLLDLGEDGAEFYQPPRNRFQRAIAERTRRQFEHRLLAPGASGAVAALRRLREGRGIVMFIDEFTRGRVHGPAFGRPLDPRAGLGTAVRLAQSAGGVVIPAYVLRRAGEARFDMHVLTPIPVVGLSVEAGMAAVNAALEPVVREHLEQWYMLHELRDLETAPSDASRGGGTPGAS